MFIDAKQTLASYHFRITYLTKFIFTTRENSERILDKVLPGHCPSLMSSMLKNLIFYFRLKVFKINYDRTTSLKNLTIKIVCVSDSEFVVDISSCNNSKKLSKNLKNKLYIF
jgi:hypothetical protein